ncbi:hypothetical protein ACEQ8H_005709 [Pleosporales sp. CAS-2024a]
MSQNPAPLTTRRFLRDYNALALYLQWVREAHHLRNASSAPRPAPAPSSSELDDVSASDDDDDKTRRSTRPTTKAPTYPKVRKRDVAHDILGLGAWVGL